MNEAIRALQREHEEKYMEADALLAKAAPTAEEQSKALGLIGDIKTRIKPALDREFQVLDAKSDLDQLRKDRDDPASKSFLHSGRVGGDGAFLGLKEAGTCVIDSFGTVLSDSGEGTFGAKAWGAIQSPEYKRGFINLLRKKGSERGLAHAEYKAIQEGLDDQGGVLAPADSLMRIVGRAATPTRLAGMVTNITTGRDRVIMPRKQYSADDLYSTAFRATWTGEVPASDSVADVDDTGLLGNVEIPVFTAMASASLTNDMVEDSAFPIQSWIENELGILYALLRDNMILNGTGKGQPTGLLVNPGGTNQPAVVLSGVAGGLGYDGLVDLTYAVPEQYDDNCSFVFNKTSTGKTIAKIKDSSNRPLFARGTTDDGIAVARPTSILGYPFAYSGFMPNVGSTAYPILFGDLRGYYLVNRLGITIQVLRETKAKRNQFELVARFRFGGQCVEPWKVKIQKSNNS